MSLVGPGEGHGMIKNFLDIFAKKIRAVSSLFFLARAEPEPIFFGPGRARATNMPRASTSQNIFLSSLFEPQKYQCKNVLTSVNIC